MKTYKNYTVTPTGNGEWVRVEQDCALVAVVINEGEARRVIWKLEGSDPDMYISEEDLAHAS